MDGEALSVDVKAPEAAVLQDSVQLKLGQLGYASADDAVMAEYVVVMLANRKTAQQVSDEMRDLIGSDYDDHFAEWLWNEAQTVLGGGQPSMTKEMLRPTARDRSMSPDRRRAAQSSRRSNSPEQRRDDRRENRRRVVPSQEGVFAVAMSGLAGDTRSSRRQAPPQRQVGIRMAGRSQAPTGEIELLPDSSSGPRGPAMDAPSLQGEDGAHSDALRPPTGPRELLGNPRGPPTGPRAGNGYDDVLAAAPRGPRAANARAATQHASDQLRQAAKQSILARVGVPDPRAPEFVPGGPSRGFAGPVGPTDGAANAGRRAAPSLLERMSPMKRDERSEPHFRPVEQVQPVDSVQPAESITRWIDPQTFPARPTEKEACRFLLKCTNPTCPKSHPTPCLANTPREDSAMMLSEEPCTYGARCRDADCVQSHPSPAVSVLATKAAGMQSQLAGFHHQQQRFAERFAPTGAWAPQGPGFSRPAIAFGARQAAHQDPNAGRPPPCKYQQECTNAQCAYSHYDKDGKITASPALLRLASGVTAPDAERSTDDAADKGTSGSALDKPLSSAPSQGGMQRCRFGSSCTRHDCIYAHPEGRYIDRRSGGADTSSTPCRFGAACYRADCHFAHPPGRLVSQGGAGASGQQTHVSERLRAFNTTGEAGSEVERIIPAS